MLKSSDEFRKAKQNLLWFCTLAILMVMASFSNKNIEPDQCFHFGLFGGFSVDRAALGFLSLIYVFYLWWGFNYQVTKVDACNDGELRAASHTEFNKQLESLSEKLASSIAFVNSDEIRTTLLTKEKLSERIEQSSHADVHPRREFNRSLEHLNSTITDFESSHSRGENHFDFERLKMFSKQLTTFSSSWIGFYKTWLEKELDIQQTEFAKLSTVDQRIAKLEKDILSISTGVGRLSDKIRFIDQFKHTAYDKWTSHIVAIVATGALVLMIVQSDQPIGLDLLQCVMPEKT